MTSVKEEKAQETLTKTEVDLATQSQQEEQQHGQIFEADVAQVLSAEEKKEMEEFKETLTKYNQISRELLQDALEEEKKELDSLKKSPKTPYFHESRDERIKNLRKTVEIIKERKLAEKKKKKN